MKESRYMPGVKKHHQDSENVGKSEYIYGHQHGMIGLLASGETYQCIPVDIEIQGGTEQIEKMTLPDNETLNNSCDENSSKKETIVKKMSKLTQNYVETTGKKVLFVLDVFFPNKHLFNGINNFNKKYKDQLITIIVLTYFGILLIEKFDLF